MGPRAKPLRAEEVLAPRVDHKGLTSIGMKGQGMMPNKIV